MPKTKKSQLSKMLKALISYFFFTFFLTCSAQVSENSFIHCVVLGPVKLRNDIQWVEITKLNCKKKDLWVCWFWLKIYRMSHQYWANFWVHKRVRVPKYGSRFPSTGPILGIYLGPGSRVRVQVPKYGSRFPSTGMGWLNIGDSYGNMIFENAS